ncbi:MAG: flavodoxin/nitric oxide synthase [Alphaproteobacteria bacterium]|nr:flavodoxin/nitric oxide synthase [Alphaproteobacteria bacterium]
MADILIIVGTESGNSQMVADLLEEELPAIGHTVEILDSADCADAGFGDREYVLICCSTHGDGELPDNIIPLAESLEKQAPDLGHIRYGVIALGDQTYHDTFCQGGRTMDSLFAKLGASRVGDRLEIDACVQPLPDEDALDWAKEWVTLL